MKFKQLSARDQFVIDLSQGKGLKRGEVVFMKMPVPVKPVSKEEIAFLNQVKTDLHPARLPDFFTAKSMLDSSTGKELTGFYPMPDDMDVIRL